MALSAATQEAIWWRSFRAELSGIESKLPLFCDSQGAMFLAEKNHGTKRIDLRHHFLREQLEIGTIELHHVGSYEQVADVLTKPTSSPKLLEARTFFGIKEIHDYGGMLIEVICEFE